MGRVTEKDYMMSYAYRKTEPKVDGSYLKHRQQEFAKMKLHILAVLLQDSQYKVLAEKMLTNEMFGDLKDGERWNLGEFYEAIMAVDYVNILQARINMGNKIHLFEVVAPFYFYHPYPAESFMIFYQEWLRFKVIKTIKSFPETAELNECLDYAITHADGLDAYITVKNYLTSMHHPAGAQLADIDLSNQDRYDKMKGRFDILKNLKKVMVLVAATGHEEEYEIRESLSQIYLKCSAIF